MSCFVYQNNYQAIQFEKYKDRYTKQFDEGEEVIWATYTETKSVKTTGKYVYRSFYPDTKTMIEYREYKDPDFGIKEGVQKSWSDFGVLTDERKNINGLEQGVCKSYSRKTGILTSECYYEKGKIVGTKKYYDSETGKLKGEYTYENGNRQGEFLVYDDEGNIKEQGEYKADTLFSTNAKMQEFNQEAKTAFKAVEQMPMFGNGCPEFNDYEKKKKCSEDKMLRFIYKSLKCPADAREHGVQGMAIAQYLIDKEGNVQDVEVIRGLCQSIRDEVTRVISGMPKWVPGVQRGEKVKVLYTLPVRFKLE